MVTMQAQDDDRNGYLESAKSKASVSLGLNIAAAVVVGLSWLLIVIGIAIRVANNTAASQ